MYKLCKTEQSAARQKQFEQCLLTLMQKSKFEDISISDLCGQFQIPRKSFYRYFTSKEGALIALIDHTIMEFEQPVSGKEVDCQSLPLVDLKQYFVFWRDHKKLLIALERSHLTNLLVERSTQHAVQERLMPRYLLSMPAETQKMALTFMICGLLSMVIQWHRGGYLQSPDEMVKLVTMMLKTPLLSNEK